MKVSVVVCDLGSLTCVDMDEIHVLNRYNNPTLGGYLQEAEAKTPRFIS